MLTMPSPIVTPHGDALRRRITDSERTLPLEELNAAIANDPALAREQKRWAMEIFPPPEGPTPEGMANKLRRERDEARAERDRAETQLANIRTHAERHWLIIYECANAMRLPAGNARELPLDVAQKLYAHYAAATGDYKDAPDWFVPPPED